MLENGNPDLDNLQTNRININVMLSIKESQKSEADYNRGFEINVEDLTKVKVPKSKDSDRN